MARTGKKIDIFIETQASRHKTNWRLSTTNFGFTSVFLHISVTCNNTDKPSQAISRMNSDEIKCVMTLSWWNDWMIKHCWLSYSVSFPTMSKATTNDNETNKADTSCTSQLYSQTQKSNATSNNTLIHSQATFVSSCILLHSDMFRPTRPWISPHLKSCKGTRKIHVGVIRSKVCDGPIPCPEDSYRLWCDIETTITRWPWPPLGYFATEKEYMQYSSFWNI
jgi:uncharacterized Fe-S cluster protein YjdI